MSTHAKWHLIRINFRSWSLIEKLFRSHFRNLCISSNKRKNREVLTGEESCQTSMLLKPKQISLEGLSAVSTTVDLFSSIAGVPIASEWKISQDISLYLSRFHYPLPLQGSDCLSSPSDSCSTGTLFGEQMRHVFEDPALQQNAMQM